MAIDQKKAISPLVQWSEKLGSVDAILRALPNAPLKIRTELLQLALANPGIEAQYEELQNKYPDSNVAEEWAMEKFIKSKGFIIGCPPLPVIKAETQLASPVALNTSPLFLLANRTQERKYRKNALLVDLPSIKVRCSGEELRRDEFDYFLELVDLSSKSYGHSFRVSLPELLRRTGRVDGGSMRKVLMESLLRMCQTAVRIEKHYMLTQTTEEIYHYDFHLIDSVTYSSIRKPPETEEIPSTEVLIRLNPKIVKFFENSQYALLNREYRNSIKPPLAKLIYDIIKTEKSGSQLIRLDRIAKICCLKNDSQTYRKLKFRIKSALSYLVETHFLSEAWVSSNPKDVSDTRFVVVVSEKRSSNFSWLDLPGERIVMTESGQINITKTPQTRAKSQVSLL